MSLHPAMLACLLTLAFAPFFAGCGDDDRDETSTSRPRESRNPAPAAAAAPAKPPTAPPCTPGPLHPTGSRASGSAGLDDRDQQVQRAVRAATRTPHRFGIAATVRVIDGMSARARLTGIRRADGSSVGHLRWSGAASLLLPSALLRIERNEISAQIAGRTRELGSASGIALDVGRELLDHPFLLTPTSAVGDERSSTVTYVAPPAAVRAYARAERTGLATDLLSRARSLRITAQLRGGRLVGDHFVLVTELPPRFARAAGGSVVRLDGRTAYCPPLRSAR